MKQLQKLQPYYIPIFIIIIAAIMRLLPHPPNFAPIGALALFSGAHMGKKSRFILPISAMIISDIFLRFDSTTPFVYASFMLIILLGSWLKNKTTVSRLFATSILSSLLFFFITNFGVWAATDMYTKNLSGLVQSFAMGVPFFRNTCLSDLVFSFSFFYGHRYINSIVTQFLPSSVKSRI